MFSGSSRKQVTLKARMLSSEAHASTASEQSGCRLIEGGEKKVAALVLNAAHPDLCRASMLDQPVRAVSPARIASTGVFCQEGLAASGRKTSSEQCRTRGGRGTGPHS